MFKSHDLTEATLLQLFCDHLEQVFSLFLFALDLSGNYRREIVDAGFRLRPDGPFYRVVEPGETSVPAGLTAVNSPGGAAELVAYALPRRDVTDGDFVPDAPWQELREIELALLAGKHEVAAVFAREQEFSRFASHELRTPNMVIQGSAALLGKVSDLPAPAARAASRIRAASDELALLTETFLLLGRKEAVERPPQWVAPLIERELTRLAPLLQRENLDIRLNLDEQSEVQAPLSLLAIALGNLLKNALSYAEGHIEIALQGQVLTISNPTAAAPDQILGYGCGLTIIQRICEKLGWQIETRLEDGVFSARLAMITSEPTKA